MLQPLDSEMLPQGEPVAVNASGLDSRSPMWLAKEPLIFPFHCTKIESMYSKHRLELLSDAVFAIAMTLLVLDLKIPAEIPRGRLVSALWSQSPEWISFAITFFLAAIFWTLQSHVYELLESVDRDGLILTFIFLSFVSLLPFSTSLVSRYPTERVAFAIYLCNQFALALTLMLKLEFARSRGLAQAGFALAKLRLRLTSMCALLLSAALCALFFSTLTVAIPSILIWLVSKVAGKRLKKRYGSSALFRPV